MSVWMVAVFVLVLTLLPLVWSVRRLRANGCKEVDQRWLQAFSIDRYRPMLRLLTAADEDFLSRKCRYPQPVIRQFRAERRRIFRLYLRNLTRDFNRLHYAARELLVLSPIDRPDLSEKLVRARISFFWMTVLIEYRLALHAAGIGNVDVRGLLGSLDGLRAEFQGALATQAAAA